MAAKATILAGQLGSLLEAARLSEASREEHRRAEILADVAHALHGTPDVSAVIEALADRLRLLLRTRLVCVLLRREGPFELKAVSAETPQLANSARARHDRQTLRFAADLAQRAVAAGEPITLSIGADVHSLGSLVSPGMLIAAPFRTSRTQGAILLYPRQEGVFTAEEKALVAAVAGFGAVAVAHAELHATAHAQAHELHQLLEISSELSSSSRSRTLSAGVRACDLRISWATGAASSRSRRMASSRCATQWKREKPQRVDTPFPEGVATSALRAKEVFWTDEASRTPGVNLDVVTKYKVRQFLAVPLLGTSGRVLGMFGVLDRLDGTGISQEDIRRARALSNQAAVMLESGAQSASLRAAPAPCRGADRTGARNGWSAALARVRAAVCRPDRGTDGTRARVCWPCCRKAAGRSWRCTAANDAVSRKGVAPASRSVDRARGPQEIRQTRSSPERQLIELRAWSVRWARR